MKRNAAITVALSALIVALAASAGSAQVVAYHHRSTVAGDFLAGYGEAVLAEGIADRNHAIAYRTYIQAERDRAALNYEIIQGRLYLEEQRNEAIREKIEARRASQVEKSLAEDAAAQQLLVDVQRGVHVWPEALQRSEFAQSTALIQRLLEDWTPDGTSADNAYRTALLTQSAVLKRQVASAQEIDFSSRRDAVETLSKVSRLAKMDAVDLAKGAIAMR